jgi:hypothetical protein
LGFKESFLKAATARDVWIPSSTALAFGLSKYDGKISDYASRERPLFSSIQNAKNFSDTLAFIYLPLTSVATTIISERSNSIGNRQYFNYFNILSAPVLTYFFNNLVKNKSGRLRPDASNRESFPSSHTAIASAFSENISVHSPNVLTHHSKAFNLFNESIVGVVGWARMESKKHHLSDVLVGYSIGKFFTKFFHYCLVTDPKDTHLQININSKESFQGNISWHF